IAGLITGVVAHMSYKMFLTVAGARLGVIAAVLTAIIAWIISSFLLRILSKQDILMYFGKKRITKIFEKH
ncbi:MAG: hypothetical protein RSA70_06695, partial [Clostridia bacterium]